MPWQRKSGRKPKIVRKVLADGTVKVYAYDRGPKAHQPREIDTIAMLIQAYQSSPEWSRLAERTRDRYVRYLRPLWSLRDRRAADIRSRDIRALRDAIAATRPAAANAFVSAVSVLYAWGIRAEWVEVNPASRVEALPGGEWPAWTADGADRAMGELPEHLRRLVLLALYTGQRRADLCRLAWTNYDGTRLRLIQGKTGVSLVIPVHAALKAEMDAWERRAATILVNHHGRPWKPGSASHGMKLAIDRLGLPSGWNIHGLRKLAAANLAEAGCTPHEIAAITGHKTLQMVSHYTRSADQERLATAAIIRLRAKT